MQRKLGLILILGVLAGASAWWSPESTLGRGKRGGGRHYCHTCCCPVQYCCSTPCPPASTSGPRWNLWLQEMRNGLWWHVPGRQYVFTDYSQFVSTYNAYVAQIAPYNQNGVKYAVNWNAENVGSAEIPKPPDVNTEELGPVPELPAIPEGVPLLAP